MPSIAPLPRFRFFTRGSLGTPVRPLVGGRVYFYEAGTTTPKDTFTDSTGLVKNTNPVILDARGEADIWLGDGTYKMQVTDALGINQGGPVDGIKGTDELRQEIVYSFSGNDGFNNIGSFPSYQTLRSYLGGALRVLVSGKGIAGEFYRDTSDNSSPDNGGTIIVDALGRRWKRVHSGAADVRWFGAAGDGLADDTAYIQKAIDSGSASIYLPQGTYLFSSIVIRASVRQFFGAGPSSIATYLKRIPGATGAGISWDGANRVIMTKLYGFRLDCNSEAGETYGIDLSGFSYSSFEDIWVRLARLDGIYVDGSISPIVKQFSNNVFTNVRSNNNLRDGWRFEGGSQANSANTYITCEGAGNAGIGFNELFGYGNQTVGCIFQGNASRDFYTNGTRNTHEYYAEGTPKSTEMGVASLGNSISIRSSYPLWNSFIDNGNGNKRSVRGEYFPEQQIFNNPYFTYWTGVLPFGVSLNGTPTISSYADPGSPYDASVQLGVSSNFQAIIFSMLPSAEILRGKWVTLILEVDTSSVVDPLQTRVYCRDGVTANSNNGEFAVEQLPITSSGKYKLLAYDVKFTDSLSGTPNVIWYMAYSGAANANNIKVRSAHIVLGQTQGAAQYVGTLRQHSAQTSTINSAASGINIHLKTPGRLCYETNTGKMRYAVGSLPTSPWRATDGSGDITPV